MNEQKHCKICGKKIKIQEWKEKKEKELCFICNWINKSIELTEMAMNDLLKKKTKTQVKISWKYKKVISNNKNNKKK